MGQEKQVLDSLLSNFSNFTVTWTLWFYVRVRSTFKICITEIKQELFEVLLGNKELGIPIRHCNGFWKGHLEVPRNETLLQK